MRPQLVVVLALSLGCTFDATGFGEPPSTLSASDASSVGATGAMPGTVTAGEPTTAASGTDSDGDTTQGGGPGGDPTTQGDPTGDPTGDPGPTTEAPSTTTEDPGTSTGPACPEMQPLYVDGDGDGFGVGEPVQACPGPGLADEPGDCVDDKPDIHPGAPETCNGADDDCDGKLDEYAPDSNAAECLGCTFKTREGRLYYFCGGDKQWPAGRTFCQNYELDLAVVDGNGEHDWILEQVGDDSGLWWIGGADETEGQWKWVTGAAMPAAGQPHWSDGQPDDTSLGQGNADCAGTVSKGLLHGWAFHAGRWTDHQCDDDRPFVCEGPL